MIKIIHYTYKIVHANGKYYVGRHSTRNIEDGYMGSGKWPLSVIDKQNLTKEILTFCETLESLILKEQELLDEHIGKPLCMNFNNRASGFASGDRNPSNTESERIRKAQQVGVRNPMFGKNHTDAAKDKMSKSRKGRLAWNKGKSFKKKNNTQIPWNKGVATGLQTFTGKNHTADSIRKMKDSHANREKLTCPHCSKIIDKPNYTRYHGDKCKLKSENLPFRHISV